MEEMKTSGTCWNCGKEIEETDVMCQNCGCCLDMEIKRKIDEIKNNKAIQTENENKVNRKNDVSYAIFALISMALVGAIRYIMLAM